MPARNNRGIVTKQDVTRTAVATEHLCFRGKEYTQQ
jgi:hypothetical protein